MEVAGPLMPAALGALSALEADEVSAGKAGDTLNWMTARDALPVMAGIYWDIGAGDYPGGGAR